MKEVVSKSKFFYFSLTLLSALLQYHIIFQISSFRDKISFSGTKEKKPPEGGLKALILEFHFLEIILLILVGDFSENLARVSHGYYHFGDVLCDNTA